MPKNPLLRYALRTCWGPWAAVAIAAVEVFNLLRQGQPWRGDITWALDWAGVAFILFGPVIAGVAAIDAGRLARPATSYLVDTGRSPLRPFLLPWLATVVPAACVHLGVAAAYLILGASPNAPIPWPAVGGALLTHLLGICFYAALGSAIGRLAGPVLGGAAAAVGSVAVFYLYGISSERLAPLQFGRATATLIGLHFSPTFLLLQGLTLAVAAVLLLCLPTRLSAGRRQPTRRGALALAVVIVGLTTMTQTAHVTRFAPVAVSPTVCGGTTPQVCVYPEHTRFMPAMLDDTAAITATAKTAAVADLLPRSYTERLPHAAPNTNGEGRIAIPVDAYSGDAVPRPDLTREMIFPYHCRQLYGDIPPPMSFADDLQFAVDTLSRTTTPSRSDATRLRAVLTSFRDCQLGQARP
ncbi:hypothetical protein [Micromonospora aurantiaca (nom. illeg.)]|uniref:hypothetical protein n=1 Tax=Micromonospora aurantiaca (nom. illeg.) TaxID=47850 RepID=UPI0035B47BAB